ncbi:hypothetical protein Hypma_000492 [Hypsizygus marmoreus]|uniref:Uncharacterized protein n=1 Tax=Hypsizygus marmoreus TaxID=39966 RepID=A0A369J8G2_HYPMA|nr:hypothetical protein Hypma_000492 [Hypsizygus marmoreus]
MNPPANEHIELEHRSWNPCRVARSASSMAYCAVAYCPIPPLPVIRAVAHRQESQLLMPEPSLGFGV